jgi:site-specific recombinase XerD
MQQQLTTKMIAALEVRGKADVTREGYARCVRKFIEHHGGRCPSELGADEVEAFLLYLWRDRRLMARTRNVYSAALRFLYGVVLRRPEVAYAIARARPVRVLPVVLDAAEVARLIAAIDSPLHRMVALVCYGAGLRITEAVTLRVCDIDSPRGVLRVEHGKGCKQRDVPLCSKLLGALRAWWRQRRPTGQYLFPGRGRRQHITREAVANALGKARRRAGLHKRVSPHTLRHSYATHMIEGGADLRTVQLLLGHASVSSTALYVHVSHARLVRIESPLERLPV